eukprot:s1576_g9.t3
MVLSQWLSNSPPERKRLPKKPTEERLFMEDITPVSPTQSQSVTFQRSEAQLQASPTVSTAPLTEEYDFARMRMKARTYVGTDGIAAPLPSGSMTMIGTPKNQPTSKCFGFSRSATMEAAALSPKINEDDADEGNKGEKKNSRALSQPRSIFVHHINRFAPETAGSEEIDENDEDASSLSRCSFLQKKCQWLVSLEAFDYIMGLAIFANAILMGIQADLAVQSARTGAMEPPAVRAIAVVLGVIFTIELVLRIFACRLDFFTKPGWKWNVFDFTLVFLQISEEVVTAVAYTGADGSRSVNLSFMRILRVLRLVRIVRLVRVLRLIRELRTLVASIASTMTSLLWTVVLLLLLIFVVGICFTQVIADVAAESPQLLQEGTDTFEFYGSLMRSVMSLYQSITSGVSWRDASLPLERHSAIMGLVFAVYIAFAALAMLNVITGVFVESAMASAREENTVTVVSRMREIVEQMNINESGQMTWQQFEGQLDNPVMEAYFKSIDLSVTEARSELLSANAMAILAAWVEPMAQEHQGMQEAIDRIHSLLQAALDRGFPPERIVLCGFSQGGALALQAGLSFPHTLAGICSVAGWVSSGMPAAESRWQMPILMCHGFDDSMVPIEVARSSCKALAALGYKKVNLITFKGLRHQLSTLQFEDIMEMPRPAGCIVWMHDASIAGDVDEQILIGRLHQCLPDVQLILQRVPPCREGKSFGRALLDEITEQLRKAHRYAPLASASGWPLSSVILGGFGAGGTAALLGLLFPQLAGLVSCSGFLADCFPEQPAEPGSDQLILLTHGVEDVGGIMTEHDRWNSFALPVDTVALANATQDKIALMVIEESLSKVGSWQQRDFDVFQDLEGEGNMGLFLLLDIDEQGFIDVEEFIAGCCRIHGPAKAIDLTTLMCQVRKLHMELRSPRNRRQPSFGLTAHPENAIEGTKDSNVELTESPLTEKAKQAKGAGSGWLADVHL